MKNIIISKPEELEKIKKAMAQDGAEKIHILADFDRTLTSLYNKGKKVLSLMSLLDKNYLTPEYHRRYQALHDKYFPIEADTKIPLAEKKKAMAQWWQAVFNLLIESKLNKKDLKKLVESQDIRFRDGFNDFTVFLKSKDIPLIIISSTGVGGETISMYLEKENKLYPNIYIIANIFEWDENGYLVGVKEPIIYVANKDEAIIKNFHVFDLIKGRKNVILLGDMIEDVGMVKGFDYKNLIKIGFLSDEVEKNLDSYKNYYDVVILNDSGLDYINELLREIVK